MSTLFVFKVRTTPVVVAVAVDRRRHRTSIPGTTYQVQVRGCNPPSIAKKHT